MKRTYHSSWERRRSANLKIGFIVSLFLTLVAFNWTTERPALAETNPDFLLQEPEVKVVRTSHAPLIKPPIFKSAAQIVEVPEVTFSLEPAPEISDSLDLPNNPTVPEVPVSNSIPVAPEKPVFESPATDLPFRVVEEMPRFAGCEAAGLSKNDRQMCADTKLLEFLAKNINYPPYAREVGIEGTVIIRFVVEKDGSISSAEIVRDVGGGCGREALRVVNSMPAWVAGKQRGRPVRVQFDLPVRFRLR
jgi:protein TonB